MKIRSFATIALFATIAIAPMAVSTQALARETVSVSTGTGYVNQNSAQVVDQAGAAVALAIGEVRNNSEVKAISATTNNTSDMDFDVRDNGASAEASQSFSANFSAEGWDNGDYATATALGLGGSGLGITAAGFYTDAASGSWDSGFDVSGGLGYNATTDLPSLSVAAVTAGVNQLSAGPVLQDNFALAASGAVTDVSKLGATAVGQNNGSTIKVVVKN